MPVQESRPGHPLFLHGGRPSSKPAFLRDIVFGDGNKVGDARFTGQKVITRGMVLLLFHLKADGEQAPAPVEQKSKIHFVRQRE